MNDLENKTTEDLAKRLLEIKKEEQLIMIELWKRCPKPKEELGKVLCYECKRKKRKNKKRISKNILFKK